MKQITKLHGKLLEGCIWDERENVLYFTDIDAFRIYRYEEEKQKLSYMQLHTYVSCLVCHEDGSLIAALQDGLYRVNMDMQRAEKIMDSGLPQGFRYNDGKCDRNGNLWIGIMETEQKCERTMGSGSLHCIWQQERIARYGGYTIPNGMAWSEDGSLFFHVETGTGIISVYRQVCAGRLGEKVDEINLSGETGAPDGMCMDSEENLWIAMWGASEVIGYSWRDRRIFERIKVPDKNVSCCVFGGKGRNRLFITTAQDECGNGGELYVCTMSTCGRMAERYGKK